MGVSKVTSRSKPELGEVSISTSRAELSEAVSSIRPRVHKGVKGNGFGGNMRKDVKGMSRDDVGEVRDYSNAIPSIRSFVGRCVSGRGGMRKSRGRVRT